MWDNVFLPFSFILNASQICPFFCIGFCSLFVVSDLPRSFWVVFFFYCFFLPITCTIVLSFWHQLSVLTVRDHEDDACYPIIKHIICLLALTDINMKLSETVLFICECQLTMANPACEKLYVGCTLSCDSQSFNQV